jgi:hypothetical protein
MKKSLETQVQINAGIEAVWKALTGTAQWGDWNPFVLEVKGKAQVGGRLKVTLRMGKGAPMLFRPWVMAVRPGAELRWVGRVVGPWFFSGEHYFLMEPKDGGTLVTHGEKFRGIFTFLLNMDQVHENFVALNEGLKKRAEGS